MDAVINFSRAAHKVSDHSTLSQTAVMSCHDYPMDMDKYIIIWPTSGANIGQKCSSWVPVAFLEATYTYRCESLNMYW